MAYSDRQVTAFTQIAYMDLEKEYKKYCDDHGTDSAPLSEIISPSQYDKLKKMGISDSEISEWSISGIHDKNSVNGFYACIIETGDGEASVSFRGSEDFNEMTNLTNDWVGADLGLVNSICTNQHAEVDRFLAEYKDKLNEYDSLAMNGHSLGGNLAEYATVVSEKYGLDDNITSCMSLDGPGFSMEFIEKYSKEIEKMSGVIYHPRWSCVGTMLHDLPGAEYEFVTVSNEANTLDNEEFNLLTRHDTKYLAYENDSYISGEQDMLSKITSVISKGVDHLPTEIGNAFISFICGALISFGWAKEIMFDENGSLTPIGGVIMTGIFIALPVIVPALLIIAAASITVIIAAVIAELADNFIQSLKDSICDELAKLYNWSNEMYQQFKEGVMSLINNAAGLFMNNPNMGYVYVNSNPQITVDTYKLRNYASRIYDVNRRISNIDGRIDSLYWRVGLLDLWNLMQADLITGYSWRLSRAASYLNDTASDFDAVEAELTNSM